MVQIQKLLYFHTMKKCVLLITMLIGLMACNEDQEPLTNTNRATAVPPNTWTAITELDVVREAILWSKASTEDQVSDYAFYLRSGTTIQFDTAFKDTLPNSFDTLQISLNSLNVTGLDNRMRSGSLQIFTVGDSIEVDTTKQYQAEFLGWQVDDALVNGTFNYSLTINDSGLITSWSVSNISMSVFADGQAITISGSTSSTQVEGTSDEWLQDDTTKLNQVLLLSAVVSGSHFDGNYRATYSDSFLFNYRCPFPTTGQMIVSETGRAQAVITLDPTCTSTYQWQIGNTLSGTEDFR